MKTDIQVNGEIFKTNLNSPTDLSIPLSADDDNPEAWYLDRPKIFPVEDGDWIAKVSEGASVNFNTIEFNPHAHGTHTESYGHISKEFHAVNAILDRYFFKAKLISLNPAKENGDRVINREMIERNLKQHETEALIIRTLPNSKEKLSKKYSHTNWPYLTKTAADYLVECGIEHLLIDLPSVDKEKDDGQLNAHHAFWNYPENPRKQATITEMIFAPNSLEDGYHLLNLSFANFVNDAAPSRPVLYPLF